MLVRRGSDAIGRARLVHEGRPGYGARMCPAQDPRSVAVLLLLFSGGCSLNRTPLVPAMDVGPLDVGNNDVPIRADAPDAEPDFDAGSDVGEDAPIDVGVDGGIVDTGLDAPVLLRDCDTTFGMAPFYSLCEEGPTTCEFLTRRTTIVDITCLGVCMGFGSACMAAFTPSSGSTCPAASDDVGCSTAGRVYICRCTRVP